MLGLSKPKSEYAVKMYWFKFKGAKNNILEYEDVGLPFTCKFTASQEVAMISETQGAIYAAMDVETVANFPFKKNDKIKYLSNYYMVTEIAVDNNSITGYYTNKPASIVKILTLKGIK